ncbi:MAG: DUF2203 domain-containing protein [Armatimonadetes bacterium]|nr:DUF2203 domain-containing protein [Armatimonadota bacterium]
MSPEGDSPPVMILMAVFEKHFTLEEASALLPEVRSIFSEIHAIRQSLAGRQDEISEIIKLAPSNGGGPAGAAWVEQMDRIGRLLNDIISMGIQVQDIDRGLIDFPHWQRDREVFLCWELCEDRIAYWHELEAGYAGRMPLD